MTEFFSLKQAREYIGAKSRNTLKKLIDNGLPVSNIAGTKRIKKSDIDDFMKDHITNN